MDEARQTHAARNEDLTPRGRWPALAYEPHPWRVSSEMRIPRRQLRGHQGNYDAAVVPEIAHANPALTGEVLAAADEATTEITRFDAENSAELAPFASLLLRSESAASSQIENLSASAKAIALAELGDPSRPNASVIVANTHAMQAAIALAERLDEDAILAMHAALIGPSRPEWTGHWRREQVWIGGTSWGPHQALYIPPHHDRVPAAMTDLLAFMHRDDLPVLVQAALAHAQFETIHPFPDGNGRVGRAMVHSLLRAKGVTRTMAVPISAGLLVERDAYFTALGSYRAGQPGAIVEQFADAAFRGVANGRRLIADLERIRESWRQRITARRGATAWRLVEVLSRQPVIDSNLTQEQLSVSAPAANGAIEHLVGAGVLTQVGSTRRYRRWAALEVLEALDAFAARAGRRAG